MLALAGRDTALRRAGNTGGGEWAGPCPFCGGEDRFRVQPDHPRGGRWFCRGCGYDRWHDAIDYIMRREHVDFRDACAWLGARAPAGAAPQRDRSKEGTRELPATPEAATLAGNGMIAAHCAAALWRPAGRDGRDYLHQRGLSDETLKRWGLGWSAGTRFEDRWVAPGVVIPTVVDGAVWSLKIRLVAGHPVRCVQCGLRQAPAGPCPSCGHVNKYRGVAGNTPGLFGAGTLRGRDVAVLCEGEFDAMLLHQQAGDLAGVITLGSAAYPLLVERWAGVLLPLKRLYAIYDRDAAGQRRSRAVGRLSQRVRTLRPPQAKSGDKDLTDYHLSGGDLRDWLSLMMQLDGFQVSDATGK
jgi:DNA primase